MGVYQGATNALLMDMGIDWNDTLYVAAGWLFDGTIASNTRLALLIALVVSWVATIVPDPKPRTTRGHYWLDQ